MSVKAICAKRHTGRVDGVIADERLHHVAVHHIGHGGRLVRGLRRVRHPVELAKVRRGQIVRGELRHARQLEVDKRRRVDLQCNRTQNTINTQASWSRSQTEYLRRDWQRGKGLLGLRVDGIDNAGLQRALGSALDLPTEQTRKQIVKPACAAVQVDG